MCMFCRPFVVSPFFFWPLCCLFFDLHILINPLVQTLLQTLLACLILIIRRFIYRYHNLITQFLKKLFPFLTRQVCLCNFYILVISFMKKLSPLIALYYIWKKKMQSLLHFKWKILKTTIWKYMYAWFSYRLKELVS